MDTPSPEQTPALSGAPRSKTKAGAHRGLVGLSWFFFIIGFLLLLIGLFVLVGSTASSTTGSASDDRRTALIIGGIGLFFLLLGLSGFLWTEKLNEDARKAEVTRILDSPEGDYFERLVKINVENLSAYYVTVKSHANKSFLTSLAVGLVGFGFIGFGMAQSMKGGQTALPVATLSGVSGVATEFISAVFFYLYNKTVRQMKEYHDSLLAVQNILLSFKLVGEMEAQEKPTMIAVMINYLVGQRAGHSAVLPSNPTHTIPPALLTPEQPNGAPKQVSA